ncbi:hypothetical protein D3C74_386610 [compost metagenome]
MGRLLQKLLNDDQQIGEEQIKLQAFLVVENFNLLERKWLEKNSPLSKEMARNTLKSILSNVLQG